MSERNVRFARDDDTWDGPDAQVLNSEDVYRQLNVSTPTQHRRTSGGSFRNSRGYPSPNNVRFSFDPSPGSPHSMASPVVRDPTPYHRYVPSDSEEDDEKANENTGYDVPYVLQSNRAGDENPVEATERSVTTMGRRNNSPQGRGTPRQNNNDIPSSPALYSPSRPHYGRQRSSEDTKYGESLKTEKWDQEPYSPPQAHIRTKNEETVRANTALRPVLRHTLSAAQANLEEGGMPAKRGMTQNLMSIYGLSRRHPDRDSLVVSRTSSLEDPKADSTVWSRPYYRRVDSCTTALGNSEAFPLDPDDPRITGVKSKRLGMTKFGKRWKRSSSRGPRRIVDNVASITQRQTFILRLAKALLTFGAPSHRVESQLDATSSVLEVDAQFVHLPSVIIASFGDPETQTSDTHFVKAGGRLALGRLHNVHQIYRQVVHDEISAEEGTVQLIKLMKEPPIYGLKTRCLIAFACCALICPLAFGGSFIDMWVAGAGGAILCLLQLRAATKSSMYANVFEISVAILMSFVARALSSIPGQLFCYEAISSSGVVLILPGYLILCSALELASKNLINGSVRMVYAIIYSLFLGFGLTIGSDLYYIIDPHARNMRQRQVLEEQPFVSIHGTFTSENATGIPPFDGVFTFTNGTNSVDAHTVLGCYRDPSWPWYKQDFPFWSMFILVPAFSLFSSSWNLQPLRSKQLPVMVIISCCAFAANKAANAYIFDRSDIVSAIGAFVVGILGNAYSRIFRGTAFQCMVIGVLFLVPSGIAAAGGLAENYRGVDGDQYSTGLAIGLRMVQVAIGITVGLFGSGLVVYSFGSRKNAALFAF